MSRSQLAQRQRTQNNPLNLGTFSQTSLRCLRGTLGPQNRTIGYQDTNYSSNGGFGGGTYNHWFKVTLTKNACLIVIKGDPRPKYIQTSVYDLNTNPIEGRSIFQQDSIPLTLNGDVYYPYAGVVMGAQSNLYNFADLSFDKGDERYYLLSPGSYLLCISTTRNEPLDYQVGLVAEFVALEPKILAEELTNFIVFENDDQILCDYSEDYTGEDERIHSLAEWQLAWQREHQDTDRFPDLFIPYTTTL